jgi:hypothetical protein
MLSKYHNLSEVWCRALAPPGNSYGSKSLRTKLHGLQCLKWSFTWCGICYRSHYILLHS